MNTKVMTACNRILICPKECDGKHIALICSGGITSEAMEVAKRLKDKGHFARVVSMHTIKPMDVDEIRACMDDIGCILTIEENTVVGGMGSGVAEVLAEAGYGGSFKRMGMQDIYSSVVGDQNYLRQHYNLEADAIEQTALSLIMRNDGSGSQL